jgi:hypothetical protein
MQVLNGMNLEQKVSKTPHGKQVDMKQTKNPADKTAVLQKARATSNNRGKSGDGSRSVLG